VIEVGNASLPRRLIAVARRRADDSIGICRALGWRYTLTPSINAPRAVARIRTVNRDLAVHAGAGIPHDALLQLPRLGTIGAHMALLPRFRGMNVAEWAALTDHPVGRSVYWMTRGIDTGPVILTRHVGTDGCASIASLRDRVDAAQLDALDAVLRMLVDERRVARAREQRAEDGQQFYTMHAELRASLGSRRQRAPAAGAYAAPA
jgi:methionyl-tRNA formyltransferase